MRGKVEIVWTFAADVLWMKDVDDHTARQQEKTKTFLSLNKKETAFLNQICSDLDSFNRFKNIFIMSKNNELQDLFEKGTRKPNKSVFMYCIQNVLIWYQY